MSTNTGVVGVLSRLERDASFIAARESIRLGFVPRDDRDPGFRAYRRYMAELEPVVESDSFMDEIGADASVRIWFFRVFGYRGDCEFTLMPEVWMRDLPLLVIGRGAHLGYGMVLGTGQVTLDGAGVGLAPIAIGERSFCNQHAVVEGGAVIGADAAIGIRALVGPSAHVSDRAQIGDFARIGREAVVGAGARIGHGARIGQGAVIDPGVEVGDGARIPAHHRMTAAGLYPLLQASIAA